ncbi:hypothetical protein BJX62DRAFT_243237 [Aspergillus germanicus]
MKSALRRWCQRAGVPGCVFSNGVSPHASIAPAKSADRQMKLFTLARVLGQYFNVHWIARFPCDQPTTATCFCDRVEMYWIAYVAYSAFTGDESHIRPGMLSQTGSPKEFALSRLVKLWEKASTGHSAWDTVSSCYMLGGEDIRKVHWPRGGSVPDIDAFV